MIRQDVLGHVEQDLSLDAVVKLVEAKESGKRSEASLTVTEGAYASSSYKASKKRSDGEHCLYCGEPSHEGGNIQKFRRQKCKAFGQTCGNCGRLNHFAKVCSQRKNNYKKAYNEEKASGKEEAGLMYDMLCTNDTYTDTHGHSNRHTKPIILDHHIFSDANGRVETHFHNHKLM